MDRRVEIEHIQRIRREITTERAKVSTYASAGITLATRIEYMKLIGFNNHSRDDCYKVIGVLANITGESVRSLHQKYDVE